MGEIFWINSEGDTNLDDTHEDLKNFPARERRVFTKWDACTKYTNSLFRVQARIREDWTGREHEEITVTTEFIALVGREGAPVDRHQQFAMGAQRRVGV